MYYLYKQGIKKKEETKEDYETRVKKTKTLKNVLYVIFPVSYYILGVLGIVSFTRFKYGKPYVPTDEEESEAIKKILENADKFKGKYLYTKKHVDLLKKTLQNFDNGNIKAMTVVSTVYAGGMIFVLSIALYIAYTFVRKYPIESKIGAFIVLICSFVAGSIYMFHKHKEFIYLFIPTGFTMFGTNDRVQKIIVLSLLLGLTLLYLLLINTIKLNLKILTNGNYIIDNERNINDISSTDLTNILKSGQFSISSWFYFLAGNTINNQEKILSFDIIDDTGSNTGFYLSLKPSSGDLYLKDISNDNILISVKVEFQKWNNVVINYNGSDVDLFINNKLSGTTNNIYLDLTKNVQFNVGSQLNGGMAKVVYYNNILKSSDITKNYLVFKDTLKNKV